MNSATGNPEEWIKNFLIYKEFLAERQEILRHKWIESEKRGYDIGYERALLNWVFYHRAGWRKVRNEQLVKELRERFPDPLCS
jgi:hypothetical protein